MTHKDILQRFYEEPGAHAVLDTDLRIVEIGPEYLRVTQNTREGILGKLYLNTISEPNPERHRIIVDELRQSLSLVTKTHETNKLPIFRCDILDQDGKPSQRWWSSAHIPVLEDGKLEFIVIRLEDHTISMISSISLRAQRRSNYILYLLVIGALVLGLAGGTRLIHKVNSTSVALCQVQVRGLSAQRHLRSVMTDIDTLVSQPPQKGTPPPSAKVMQTVQDLRPNLDAYVALTNSQPKNQKC